MPAAPARAFTRTLERVGQLVELQSAITERGRPPQFLSDVLRGALVLGVAALDALVGDSVAESIPSLARRGMLGDVIAKWIKDEPKAVLATFAEEDPHQALAELCRKQLTDQTFQRADAIEGVLRDALGCTAPWERAAQALSDSSRTWTAAEVKDRLDEFVKRRNNIVHKGDLKPNRGTTQLIQRKYVQEATRVIKAVGDAVAAVIDERME